MKNPLLIILTLITISANAQTLVDTNKVWNVVSCLNFGPCGTTVFRFGSDTIIGIYQYKQLEVSNDSGGVGFFFLPLAAREDTNTKQVYFYSGNNEYLGYDFSLNQGDTFTTNFWNCSFQMIVGLVDSVTLLNGESRKRMFLSGDTWIEGVGSLYGPTNMGFYSCNFDIYPELNCFKENDTLKFENVKYTNCFYNTLGVPELFSKNNVKIIPNPFSDFTTLTFENPLHESSMLKLFNTYGQTIKEYLNIKGNEIKIEKGTISCGIYFFQLVINSKLIANGKLVIE